MNKVIHQYLASLEIPTKVLLSKEKGVVSLSMKLMHLNGDGLFDMQEEFLILVCLRYNIMVNNIMVNVI